MQDLMREVGLEGVPRLTALEFGGKVERLLEQKIPEIQNWLTDVCREPYIFSEAFVTLFQYPFKDALKSYQLTIDYKYYEEDEKQNELSIPYRPSSASIVPELTYDATHIQVECYSYERKRNLQYFLLRFHMRTSEKV